LKANIKLIHPTGRFRRDRGVVHRLRNGQGVDGARGDSRIHAGGLVGSGQFPSKKRKRLCDSLDTRTIAFLAELTLTLHTARNKERSRNTRSIGGNGTPRLPNGRQCVCLLARSRQGRYRHSRWLAVGAAVAGGPTEGRTTPLTQLGGLESSSLQDQPCAL
jgi:hypothetical protein